MDRIKFKVLKTYLENLFLSRKSIPISKLNMRVLISALTIKPAISEYFSRSYSVQN